MIGRLLAALALIMGLAGTARAEDNGRFVELASVATTHIKPPAAIIWLPPGYDSSKKRRYGVVYMHDAQNLFFAARSNFNKSWAADKAALRLIRSGRVEPFIIVGVNQPGMGRAGQYMPQRLYTTLPQGVKDKLASFLNGPVYSDAYLKFIVEDLKPMIDKRYRTRRDRAHTAIMGSSMGGLISLYAIAEYPQVFGLAGCVSTHWPLGDPERVAAVQPELRAAWDRYLTERLGPPAGRHIWFDHGDQTLDRFYAPWQQAADATLIRIGWQPQRDFETRSYPGAAHEENAWAARLDEIFGWLLAAHADD